MLVRVTVWENLSVSQLFVGRLEKLHFFGRYFLQNRILFGQRLGKKSESYQIKKVSVLFRYLDDILKAFNINADYF